ncbi:GAF domain-containing protein [soil metagenome]
MQRQAFSQARAAILRSHDGRASLCQPFITAFGVTGAAVSVLVGPASQTTICASDALASRLDELQFDLGEGPCWTALADRAPVLLRDVGSEDATWPAFSHMVRDEDLPVGGMYAFPLVIGSLEIGAVDLYSSASGDLEPEFVAEASSLADLTSWQVLRRILDDHAEPYDGGSLGYARREIHQATGMLIVQLDIGAEDAELLLRAHAFSSGRTVREVANDIVERRLDFSSGSLHEGPE